MGSRFWLAEIDSNPKLAGLIAIIMIVAVVVICVSWLIIKKVLLNRKYHADEQYVKEYRKKLKEREKQAEEVEKKRDTIGEDF